MTHFFLSSHWDFYLTFEICDDILTPFQGFFLFEPPSLVSSNFFHTSVRWTTVSSRIQRVGSLPILNGPFFIGKPRPFSLGHPFDPHVSPWPCLSQCLGDIHTPDLVCHRHSPIDPGSFRLELPTHTSHSTRRWLPRPPWLSTPPEGVVGSRGDVYWTRSHQTRSPTSDP